MKAAMLWSGGKDSCLAFHRALERGVDFACLATFTPADGHEFLAHPRWMMAKQASAIGLPHFCLPVSEPFEAAYEERLLELRKNAGAEVVVTGDIDLAAGGPDWIAERCSAIGIQTMRPLWREDRRRLMNELIERGIRARITWINHAGVPASWRGRIIDRQLLDEMDELPDRTEIDLCGENGEYHTMAVAAPAFHGRVIDR